MFIDRTKIYVKAGSGGKGCESFYRDIYNRRGWPDGGPGGDGGDIIFQANQNIQTLLDFQYKKHLTSQSGGHGSSSHKKGARGEDLLVKVPPGTIIRNADTDLVLRDLARPGDSVVIARGGKGGRGNSKNYHAESGAPGEEKTLILELKLIADAGIIGYPNAGKSTLISRISSARPKIANYPFTTKEPVLGVVEIDETANFVVCEIPGLIEGAHEGRGLGDKFLKHVERTRVLIHLVDAAAVEGRDPLSDYVKLNHELRSYSKELAKKPQVVVMNKIDIPEAAGNIRRFKKKYPKTKAFAVSSVTGKGVKELLNAVYSKLKKS